MIDVSLIKSGQTVAVALSGGKDSVFLLSMLLAKQEELNITVKAVHVEHGIRKESYKDAEFVKNYCEKLAVPLKIFNVDAVSFSNENHLSLEEGARLLRYQIFNDLIASKYADVIATAHHKNDSVETVLFNLFRGSGLKGVKGISKTNGNIIRPILNVKRLEIDNYVKEHNLPFVTDQTNFSNEYSRNYIRNEVLPVIENRFDSFIDNVYKFSCIAKEEDEFLDDLARKSLTKKGEKLYLSLEVPPVLFRRAVFIALKELTVYKNYEQVHAENVLSLVNLQSGSKITLPKNVVAVREHDKVVFYIDNCIKDLTIYPFSKGEFIFNDNRYEISDIGDSGLMFDKDKIPKGAVIRTRRDGDVFTKFGGGTKKLKEFLIDKKIPLSARDNIPVIAKDNVVYLVFGIEISNEIKITKQTKTIFYAK